MFRSDAVDTGISPIIVESSRLDLIVRVKAIFPSTMATTVFVVIGVVQRAITDMLETWAGSFQTEITRSLALHADAV